MRAGCSTSSILYRNSPTGRVLTTGRSPLRAPPLFVSTGRKRGVSEVFPTAAAARPSSLCFLPAPGPFPAFQFFLFRHAAPSFPSFSFPFLSRSTLFLLPLCLLFSFAPTGPSALPFRTSSDFRFSQLPVRFVPFFLPIPPLFSALFPARPAVLPSTIPALPVSVSRLLGLCFLFSCPVSCSPALFPVLLPCFLFSRLCFPSARPLFPVLLPLFPVLPPLFPVRPALVFHPLRPIPLPPLFRPLSAPFCPLFPFFRTASPPFPPPAGGGLRARLTIGNKFPAIAFLFC